jgi:hypothetical protein
MYKLTYITHNNFVQSAFFHTKESAEKAAESLIKLRHVTEIKELTHAQSADKLNKK